MPAFRLILALLFASTMIPMFAAAPAAAEVDIYITEGNHNVNGRQWRTTCEPYSATKRCRTEIFATQVSEKGGVFTQTNGWVFNNLTYAPSPRALWKGNPIAGNGEVGGKVSWAAADGRKWRTECDTPTTGNGGCRSYIQATVIEAVKDATGGTVYRWATKEILNNMVRFTAPAPAVKPAPQPTVSAQPTPTAKPTPTSTPSPPPAGSIDLNTVADPNVRACIQQAAGIGAQRYLTPTAAAAISELDCQNVGIASLKGFPKLPNLHVVDFSDNQIADLGPLSTATSVTWLGLGSNRISNVGPLATLTKLTWLNLDTNDITDVSPLAQLSSLRNLFLDGNDVSNLDTLENLVDSGCSIDILPGTPTDLSFIEDEGLRQCLGTKLPQEVTSLYCAHDRVITTLSGLEQLPNLTQITINWVFLVDISALAKMPQLQEVDLRWNEITDVSPLAGLTGLSSLLLEGNEDISNVGTLDGLAEAGTFIDIHPPYPKVPVDLTPITDVSLLACIQEGAGIGDALSLQPTEIVALTSLDCSGRGIVSVEGFPTFPWLTFLDLSGNDIQSVSPLSGQKRLREVRLIRNPVKDLLSVEDLRWGGWANDLQVARADASPLEANGMPDCRDETYFDGLGYQTSAGSLRSSYYFWGVETAYVVQTDMDTCAEVVQYPVAWPEVAEGEWAINSHGLLHEVREADGLQLQLVDWGGKKVILHEFPAESQPLWNATGADWIVVVAENEMLTLDSTGAALQRTALPHANGIVPHTWTVLRNGLIQYWTQAGDGTGYLCRAEADTPFSCQPVNGSVVDDPNPWTGGYRLDTLEGTFWSSGAYWAGYLPNEAEPTYLPELFYASIAVGPDAILYYLDLNDGGLYRLMRTGPEMVRENPSV